jgi:hypothetical protein
MREHMSNTNERPILPAATTTDPLLMVTSDMPQCFSTPIQLVLSHTKRSIRKQKAENRSGNRLAHLLCSG